MEALEKIPMPSPEDGHSGSLVKVLSAQSSTGTLELQAAELKEGKTPQELPPMDGGSGAWIFCASAFIIEMMIWGFSLRYGLLALPRVRVSTWLGPPQLRHLPRSGQICRGRLAYSRVGVRVLHVASAIQYGFTCVYCCGGYGHACISIRRGKEQSSHVHDWGGGSIFIYFEYTGLLSFPLIGQIPRLSACVDVGRVSNLLRVPLRF